MKKFKWIVEFTIDETWVGDGFELTDERANSMIRAELSYACFDEVEAKVIKAPSQEEIHNAQASESTESSSRGFGMDQKIYLDQMRFETELPKLRRVLAGADYVAYDDPSDANSILADIGMDSGVLVFRRQLKDWEPVFRVYFLQSEQSGGQRILIAQYRPTDIIRDLWSFLVDLVERRSENVYRYIREEVASAMFDVFEVEEVEGAEE